MLTTKPVLRTPGISVTVVECDGRHRGWSAEERVNDFALVLVRSGAFRRRADGTEALAEPTAGYLERPGSVHQVAHPAGGDVCTAIGLSSEAVDSMLDPARLLTGSSVHIEPAEDLAHRMLLKRWREGAEEDELVEQTLALVARAFGLASRSDLFPVTGECRRMADRMREALNEDPGLDLQDLADLVGRSMYHVSRAFKAATGLTVSQYRLKVRARLALDLLEAGESNLAQVAVECGFADQPHMTRTLRREVALTPRSLRRALTTSAAPSGSCKTALTRAAPQAM